MHQSNCNKFVVPIRNSFLIYLFVCVQWTVCGATGVCGAAVQRRVAVALGPAHVSVTVRSTVENRVRATPRRRSSATTTLVPVR